MIITVLWLLLSACTERICFKPKSTEIELQCYRIQLYIEWIAAYVIHAINIVNIDKTIIE